MNYVHIRVWFLAVLVAPALALAEAWPAKPVTLLTPFPPGVGPDIILRPLAGKLAQQLGQPVVLEVRITGGTDPVLQQVARAAPDGYTLVPLTNSNLIERYLRTAPGRDPVEFAHASRIAVGESALMVPASSPFQAFKDLVTMARASPGKLNYGSGGIGVPSHLQGALLQALTGTEMVHVPFKNTADIVPALIRGDLHFAFQAMPFAAPFVRAGKARLLATTGSQRSPQFPDVPALHELVRSSLVVQENWLGLSFPPGTPAAIVRRMHAEVRKALSDASVEKALEATASRAAPSESPEEFSTYVQRENEKRREVVRLSGAKPE